MDWDMKTGSRREMGRFFEFFEERNERTAKYPSKQRLLIRIDSRD